jgi:hypothetical protein
MARPKQDIIREIEFKIRLDENELKELEEFAEYMELPLSTFVRNLVLYAKEDAEIYKKLGFFKGVKKLQDWGIVKKNKDT